MVETSETSEISQISQIDETTKIGGVGETIELRGGVWYRVGKFFGDVWRTSVSFYKGLRVTIVNFARSVFLRQSATIMWNPQWQPGEGPWWSVGDQTVSPPLYPRYRGIIGLTTDLKTGRENCVGCLACERICPDHCIHIETEKREGHRGKYPTKFIIDYNLCSFCGLCVEVCPTPALVFTSTLDVGGYTHADLIFDKKKLMEVGDREQAIRGDASVWTGKKSQQVSDEELAKQEAAKAARSKRERAAAATGSGVVAAAHGSANPKHPLKGVEDSRKANCHEANCHEADCHDTNCHDAD